jgi:hypothetical protein
MVASLLQPSLRLRCVVLTVGVGYSRFVVAGNPETLAHFEGVLHNVCTVILQQDVERACFRLSTVRMTP